MKKLDDETYKSIEKDIFETEFKFKAGLIDEEINPILKKYKVKEKDFNEALGIRTVMIDKDSGKTINYHRDVYFAIINILRKE